MSCAQQMLYLTEFKCLDTGNDILTKSIDKFTLTGRSNLIQESRPPYTGNIYFRECNQSFGKEYNALPADLPEDWYKITKEQAFESIKSLEGTLFIYIYIYKRKPSYLDFTGTRERWAHKTYKIYKVYHIY